MKNLLLTSSAGVGDCVNHSLHLALYLKIFCERIGWKRTFYAIE